MDIAPQEMPAAAPSEDPDAAVCDAVGRLRPGWVVLRDCVLSDGGDARVDYALLHPNVGVALLDVSPNRTPDAAARLRYRLDAAKFPRSFPGHLPVVYRSLPAGELRRLGAVFDQAFGAEGAIDLPSGAAWMDSVQRALAPEPPETAAAAVRAARGGGRHGTRGRRPAPGPAFPRPARRAVGPAGSRALVWSGALALLVFGGGAAALHHFGLLDTLHRADAVDRAAEAKEEATLGGKGPGRRTPPSAASTPGAEPTVIAGTEPEGGSAAPTRMAPAPSAEPRAEDAAARPVEQPAPAPVEAALAAGEPPGTADPGPVALDTGRGARDAAGEVEGPPAARVPPPDTNPPSAGASRDEAAPAPAEADRLTAEIAKLERRLEALEGAPAGGGAAEAGATDEGRAGEAPEVPAAIAAEATPRVPPADAAENGDAAAVGAVAPVAPAAPVPPMEAASMPEPPSAAAPLRADEAPSPAPPPPPPQPAPSEAVPASPERADGTAVGAAPTAPPKADGSAEAPPPTALGASPEPGTVEAAGPSPLPDRTGGSHPSSDGAAIRSGTASAAPGGQTAPSGAPPTRDAAAGAAVASPAPPPALVGALIARGDAMVERRDISAARLLYERVAAGSARAAAALARTYDPEFLAGIGARGTFGDTALAVAWYRKAASLGDGDALARAEALSGPADHRGTAQRRP